MIHGLLGCLSALQVPTSVWCDSRVSDIKSQQKRFIDSDASVLSDVVLRLYRPIRGLDGSIMHELHVPKGTVAITSSWGSNFSKDIWGEDAQEWKPERWLAPLAESVREARIPGVYSNMYVSTIAP